MASNSRRQIESWLSTIDVSGSVLDVGGLFWPVKGRTKSWDVTDYKILDIKPSRNGVKADYVVDLNEGHRNVDNFDVAFCIEVADHFWDPVNAFCGISQMVRPGGTLYVSSNFMFPHHTGFDCVRLTSTGLTRILKFAMFNVVSIEPRKAVDDDLYKALSKESKAVYHRGDIGYFVRAIRA